MNGANFHVFKGSDWQTVAVRPTTIKADLYSLALSPIAISDVTVWSSPRRNFAELHLVLKGLDVEWKDEGSGGAGEGWNKSHTHLWAQSSPFTHLQSWKWTWQDKRKQWDSHTIMFIISISRLIEMFQNQKMTNVGSNGFVSTLSADNCPSDVRNCVKRHSVKCAADT